MTMTETAWHAVQVWVIFGMAVFAFALWWFK